MGNKVEELEAQLKEARKSQLFVNFLSPGTLFSESRCVEVESRDLVKIAAHAKTDVIERHRARPYGFRFEDGNGTPLTGIHYLTGKVIKRDDVPDDEKHSIMRSNMFDPDRCVCVENTNSFKFSGEFGPKDVVIDWDGNVVHRGNEPDLVAYRAEVAEQVKAEYGG